MPAPKQTPEQRAAMIAVVDHAIAANLRHDTKTLGDSLGITIGACLEYLSNHPDEARTLLDLYPPRPS